MNVILKRDPVWLESLPSPHASPSLLLLGGDGQQVAVPAPLLLAASPLVRNILTDLLLPVYGLCSLSLPAVTGEVLQAVVDIFTSGVVVCEHEDGLEKVRQVFEMLGVEVSLVSCHVERIQVDKVLDMSIKLENDREETDFKFEVIVKAENKENNNVAEEAQMLGLIPCPKNSTHTLIPCNLCIQKFSSKSVLKRHVKNVHEDLVRNINDDHDKSEIPCNLCSQIFMHRSTLLRHFKTAHSNIKFPCHLCPQKFTRKPDLVRHLKSVHFKIEISCHLCPKKFFRKDHLVGHIKAVHFKIEISCHLCPKKFTRKDHLVGHIKAIHDQIRICCNICQKKFKYKRDLRKHTREVHD